MNDTLIDSCFWHAATTIRNIYAIVEMKMNDSRFQREKSVTSICKNAWYISHESRVKSSVIWKEITKKCELSGGLSGPMDVQ